MRGGSQGQKTANWHPEPNYLSQWDVEGAESGWRGPVTEKERDLDELELLPWLAVGFRSKNCSRQPLLLKVPEGPLWLPGLQRGMPSTGHKFKDKYGQKLRSWIASHRYPGFE